MATQLQIRRGTSTQVAAFTGAEGEIVVNTTNDSVHVNDGSTQGGFELARVDGSNWAVTNSISIGGSITTSEDQSGLLTLGRFSSGVPYSLIRPSTNATGLEIRTFAGNALARFLNSGVTELYNNASLRLSTTSTGIALTSTGATDLTLQDTDGGFAASKINVQNGGRDLKLTAPQDIILNVGSSDVVTILNGGNFGIGLTNPATLLDIAETTSGTDAIFGLTAGTGGRAQIRSVAQSDATSSELSFHTMTASDTEEAARITKNANLLVGRTSSLTSQSKSISSDTVVSVHGILSVHQTNCGVMQYTNDALQIRAYGATAGSGNIQFKVGGGGNSADTEKMRLDASGNLLLGVTSTTIPGVGNTTAGVSIRGDDGSFFSRSLGSGDTNNVVSINRTTAEGPILGFAKDGTTIGKIGVVATNNLFINGDTIGLAIGDDNVYPANSSGASTDGATDLGDAVARWRDAHLSRYLISHQGAFLGGNSSGNYLHEYEEGTFTPNLSFGGVASGISWNTQAGRYTKIGRLVLVGVYLYTTGGRGSQTGNATVNMPFLSEVGHPDLWVPISNRSGITAGSNKTLTIYFPQPNFGSVRFYAGDNGGGANNILTHASFAASGTLEVSFTISYMSSQ